MNRLTFFFSLEKKKILGILVKNCPRHILLLLLGRYIYVSRYVCTSMGGYRTYLLTRFKIIRIEGACVRTILVFHVCSGMKFGVKSDNHIGSWLLVKEGVHTWKMPSGVEWNGVPSCPPCLNQQAFLQAWYLVPGSGTIAWFPPSPPLPFRLPPSPSPFPFPCSELLN